MNFQKFCNSQSKRSNLYGTGYSMRCTNLPKSKGQAVTSYCYTHCYLLIYHIRFLLQTTFRCNMFYLRFRQNGGVLGVNIWNRKGQVRCCFVAIKSRTFIVSHEIQMLIRKTSEFII